jgi:hypothetical protein
LATVTEGDVPRFVNVLPATDLSCACQDAAPSVDVAVAPSLAEHEPPEVAP